MGSKTDLVDLVHHPWGYGALNQPEISHTCFIYYLCVWYERLRFLCKTICACVCVCVHACMCVQVTAVQKKKNFAFLSQKYGVSVKEYIKSLSSPRKRQAAEEIAPPPRRSPRRSPRISHSPQMQQPQFVHLSRRKPLIK